MNERDEIKEFLNALFNKFCTKKKKQLTAQEQYDIGYARGFRIGKIRASRKSLTVLLKKLGKPSRRLLRTINMEVDCDLMLTILLLLVDKKITVEALEESYDQIVPDRKHKDTAVVCEDDDDID
ncbi:MAG: hypothetical protein LBC02_07735 [Planctomycetaceae bacterium]|jgi:hypothetical protein|nr:hypothetical protein [Planctomycetaceae bacterium]